ncbi:MAG: N-acetylneuraminate synthase family protein, partial [Thermodesulfobacteriota bacterium]
KQGLTFVATAHEESSLGFLDELEVPVYKIGSGEVANWPFLKAVARRGKPVILSTGMYTLDQIGRAVECFAEAGNPDLAVLHCVTRYPTPSAEVNLRAMETIAAKWNVIVGYSDHTAGYHFPLAAAALGARIIEKHISLDFDVPNAQDWKVSCGPDDLPLLVAQIREIEAGLGSGEKQPAQGEQESLLWARKSLVAARDIPAGAVVEASMLRAKRPGTGISPEEAGRVIGRVAKRDIVADELLSWEQLI